MARLTQDAAEALDGRIEDEDLDGMAEAVEVRDANTTAHARIGLKASKISG